MQTHATAAPSIASRRGLVGLEQRLLARARALGCPPGTVVVVGFSGGADSLALAAALSRVGPKLGLRPTLAHVDHVLRDISHEEQEQARGLAGALGLPFVALRVGDNPRARHPNVGLEEAARRSRYRLLAEVAAAEGAGALALAHHEGDQAETVLLHLLRGAGPAGAAGMAERSALTVPWWEEPVGEAPVRIVVWRPLLGESRAAVRAYVAGLGLAPVEDSSNEDRALRRNALRHEALPVLERISPGATAALARYGALAAEEDAALEALAAAAATRAAAPWGGVRAAVLAEEPAAIRRRAVRRWIVERTGFRGTTADRTEAVAGLLAPGDGGRRVEIGEGWVVRVGGGVLRIEGVDRDGTARAGADPVGAEPAGTVPAAGVPVGGVAVPGGGGGGSLVGDRIGCGAGAGGDGEG